jgi:hypothetical protein
VCGRREEDGKKAGWKRGSYVCLVQLIACSAPACFVDEGCGGPARWETLGTCAPQTSLVSERIFTTSATTPVPIFFGQYRGRYKQRIREPDDSQTRASLDDGTRQQFGGAEEIVAKEGSRCQCLAWRAMLGDASITLLTDCTKGN